MNLVALQQACQNRQLLLSDNQLQQFDSYAQFLIEENEKINLTAITKYEDILEKHFYDCLLIEPFINPNSTLCDVGSGAGFPGVVLAIARPDIQVSCFEPLKKRCHFLEQLTSRLGCQNVQVVNVRAEEAVVYRESFDVVTARAVANLSILLELCAPLVKLEGSFIAMKGRNGLDELAAAKNAISQLGLITEKIIETSLISESEKRLNLMMKRIKPCAKQYPRKFAQIKKKPL